MTATVPTPSKITYTSANVDWDSFHRQFDAALARVRAQLGRDYPLYIGRDAVSADGPPLVDRSPIDTSTVLGRFASATPEQVGRAVAAALMTGNAVVYKPAEDTPWTGLTLYEVYRDAGVPPGAFSYIPGTGEVTGEALWRHPGIAGVVFTGSKAVGMRIYRGLSQQWIKPCLLEMGGKNAAIVMDSADLDAAAEGVTRSAFGLQSQKCSATSRVYVHQRVAIAFLERLIERTKALTLGDPTERDVYFGPVINAAAVERFARAVARARQEGTIVLGGERLRGDLV